MASKRIRSEPTGSTPVQPSKKPSSRLQDLLSGQRWHEQSKKRLFSGKKQPSNTSWWTPEEEASLVAYVIEKGYEQWPTSNSKSALWEGAAQYLSEKGHTAKRTSGSCRVKIILKLAKLFNSPREALCALTPANEYIAGSRSALSPNTIQHVSLTPPPSSPTSIRDDCDSSVERPYQGAESCSHPFDCHNVKDTNPEVSVLCLDEAVDYIIPSFSVLCLKLRRATVTFGDRQGHFDVFLNAKGSNLPFSLLITSQCSVEVSEFSKVVDVSGFDIVDDKVSVIWEWQLVQAQNDEYDSENSSIDSESSPAQDSEAEVDVRVETRPTHTIPFKVIGCNKERRYQQVLERASHLMDSGAEVPVELRAEPDNPIDPNAIAFLCKVHDRFERVGYVVREVHTTVYDAIRRNEITAVKFKWIKYQTDWYRSGPGFYAAVNITKRGLWPSVAVRAKSTR